MKAFQFSIILFSLFLIASCSSKEKPGTADHVFVSAFVEITIDGDVDSGLKDDIKEDLFMHSLITETFRIELLD
ncbi:MAG: hypothetical protein ACJAUD_000534 [Crocinitomicaceae bacterium]|jgi:hypothetical protein